MVVTAIENKTQAGNLATHHGRLFALAPIAPIRRRGLRVKVNHGNRAPCLACGHGESFSNRRFASAPFLSYNCDGVHV